MRSFGLRWASAVGGLSMLAWSTALGSGTPENALLIIDPTLPDSLEIGNYYKNARNIPDSNVLYLRVAAANYDEFRAIIQKAFQDTLTQRGIAGKIDFVIIAPTDAYRVSLPSDFVLDSCFPVRTFSITSCFSISQFSSTITTGTPSTLTSQFFSQSENANWFSASQSYLNGIPSVNPSARRFYVSALLGYTSNSFGNSLSEIKSMIDRSVAADDSRPIGTFYFMNTTDVNRNVRQPEYPPAIAQIVNRGGTATQLNGVLPTGQSDILGIMTGIANYDAPAANMTLLPGAFCDNLTSTAGVLGSSGQTPMTRWIAAGAVGTAGTVEEPCNYLGKFPHARLHQWYFQGMALGEAYLRSLQFVPFQSMFLGDPLCRPWAFLPTIAGTSVPNPEVPVSGIVNIVPGAQARAPFAVVSAVDFLVDGVSVGTISPIITSSYNLDTTALDDGWHDFRMTARDNSSTRNVNRWSSSIIVNNLGRSAELSAEPSSGDAGQAFTLTTTAVGAPAVRVQLLHNGRIIAAGQPGEPLTVFGSTLGVGVSRVTAEVTYFDGRIARSEPVVLDVAPLSGSPAPTAPIAFDAHRRLASSTMFVIELPATCPLPAGAASYTLLNTLEQATIANPSFTGPYRLVTPNPNATGSEILRFRVQTAAGQSDGSITLHYSPESFACPADFNVDGVVNPDDLGDFINCFFAVPACGQADFNHDGNVDPDDLGDFINTFFGPC